MAMQESLLMSRQTALGWGRYWGVLLHGARVWGTAGSHKVMHVVLRTCS